MKHIQDYTQSYISELITARINEASERMKISFEESKLQVGTRYCYIDNLLPEELTTIIYEKFPSQKEMRLTDTFRERKYTTRNLEKLNPLMMNVTFAIQSSSVINAISNITGINNQLPDTSLYAGGLSAMEFGHFLGPHIDNSHEAGRKLYRTLNILFYVSPEWLPENGGNLELWDCQIKSRVTVDSRFNRLVIMETNPTSWHSVDSVRVTARRCCVSNYYFSAESPTGSDYFNVTQFSARPEQKILRTVAWCDNKLRQAVRHLLPQGVGKDDVFNNITK